MISLEDIFAQSQLAKWLQAKSAAANPLIEGSPWPVAAPAAAAPAAPAAAPAMAIPGMLSSLLFPGAPQGGGFDALDDKAAAAAAQDARDVAARRVAGAKVPTPDTWGTDAAPVPNVGAVAGLLSSMPGLASGIPGMAGATTGGPQWDYGQIADGQPTNDPSSFEPKLTGLPTREIAPAPGDPAPAPAGAPLSLNPSDYQEQDRLPPGATPTDGVSRASAAAARATPPDEGGGFLDTLSGIGKKIFDPNKAATWMALGSGFAGAGSIGSGFSRASAAAVPAMAADRAQITRQNTVADTYRALVAKGVPPAEALAASQNPEIMKATAAKYFETKPRVPHEIATDRFGNKVMGSFDPNTGKYFDTAGREVKRGGAGAANTGMPQDGGGVSGAEFLKTLPDRAYADKIKAIAEGREPFPQGQIMRSPYGRKLGEDVLAYDPTFDAVNYKSRETTRKDFTSGKSAANLTSFNTTISHLDSLAKAAEKLQNSNFPHWNKLANAVSGSYDPKFQEAAKEFQASRTAVADELTRSFRGSGGNVHDIKAWEATINQADSPAALRSAIKQAAELLRGRIDAVGDQYNRGMGTTKDPLELLNPKSAEAFKRLHEQDVQRGPGGAQKTSTGIQWSVQ